MCYALKKVDETLVATLINKIILYNNKKEIYFNSPLKDNSPDDKSQDLNGNRKIAVFRIITYCLNGNIQKK